MKLRKLILLLAVLIFLYQNTFSQADTLRLKSARAERVVDPVKATMLAAAFPGLGQIYNRKIWKIPVVYAGFGALGFSIAINSTNHTKFLNSFRDVTDAIPETNSYTSIDFGIPPEQFDRALEDPSFDAPSEAWVKDQLLNGVDYYRRYRDLSYVGVAVWYLITILDANVDANLYDYDVGENLNITIEPVPIQMVQGSTFGVGVKVTF